MPAKSFLSPKVSLRTSPIEGRGLFAIAHIPAGEIIVDYATHRGKYVSEKEALRYFASGYDYSIQVGDDLFLAATGDDELEDADFVNHSCAPNCGIRDALQIVALRGIRPGEEITFDYAMSESAEFQMNCRCGSADCRQVVRGSDWRLLELQRRYHGYFSRYLAEKISSSDTVLQLV